MAKTSHLAQGANAASSTALTSDDNEDIIVFADEKSRQMKVFCPLCSKVYNDPFITSCGVSYDGCINVRSVHITRLLSCTKYQEQSRTSIDLHQPSGPWTKTSCSVPDTLYICMSPQKSNELLLLQHTFCRACASVPEGVCPLDNSKLSLLVKNLAVAEEVGELQIFCRYGCRPKQNNSNGPREYEPHPQGCPVTMKLSQRHDHEMMCEFAPVECPNSSHCGTMLRKDLEKHLKSCEYIRCPHHKYNCHFKGTAEQLEEHLQHCKFEGVKGVLNHMEEDIKTLHEHLEEKDKKIDQLISAVTELTTKMQEIEKSSSFSQRRIDHLEEQQTGIQKIVSETMNSVGIMMNELQMVQQQLGAAGNFEPQHLFKCQGTFVGHKGPVWDLAKSRDLLFSASSDNTIKVWDLSDQYAGPRTLTGHDGIVLALCTEGDQLFSGSSDNTVKVWSVKKLELTTTFKAHDDPVCTLTCNESRLFSGSLRSIKVWDIISYKLIRKLPSQNHWVRALVAAGGFLYSGSYRAVKIWSLETLEVVHVLQCGGGSVYALAITDKHIICGTYEKLIHVWDIRTHREIGTLRGHDGTVYSLAVFNAPGQTRLFSASYDKTIRVWNMELMTCAQTMARHDGSVTCLIISRGRIFSGAVDSNIKAWQ